MKRSFILCPTCGKVIYLNDSNESILTKNSAESIIFCSEICFIEKYLKTTTPINDISINKTIKKLYELDAEN